MAKNRYTALLVRCAKLTRRMPEGVKLLSVIPDAYEDGKFVSEMHFAESADTKPDKFYEFAEKFGADMIHGELNEEYNSIWFDVDGIRCFTLLEKEDLADG